MSPLVAAEALLECEFKENDNLISVLSNIKSSKASSEDAHIASLVRGLCTHNSKLLTMLQECQTDMRQDESSHMERFKQLVNSFILWFDTAITVFEKYLQSMPLRGAPKVLESPILHCGCYIAFIDSSTLLVRNPFVLDKLSACKSRLEALLEKYSERREEERLSNISFEKVQSFGNRTTVGTHFTLKQIVERSKDAAICMGGLPVELLLLNLTKTSSSGDSFYNALAILEVSNSNERRFVMFPPFRVNELTMIFSDGSIVLKPISSTSDERNATNPIILTGSQKVLQSWFTKLEEIFSTNEKPITSRNVKLHGLGIEAISDEDSEPRCSSSSSSSSSLALGSASSHDLNSKISETSKRDSSLIMKKTLSNHGIETPEQVNKAALVVEQIQPNSSKAEYRHTEDDISPLAPVDSNDDGILTCFELVNNNNQFKNKAASSSLPNLLPQPQKVYKNMAGSAIDIHNFGKNYNPSFTSLVNEETTDSKKEVRGRRKSLFSIFRKNKSKNDLVLGESEEQSFEKTKTVQPDFSHVAAPNGDTTTKTIRQKPNLSIKVPGIEADVQSNAPLSSASSTFERTLPSPFALPSSTSTYFFKTNMAGNGSPHNNSSTSLLQSGNEEKLSIPENLKEAINSDESVDVYISPSSPKSIKVSKWKTKHGKWEMLTTSDNLFVKIVANYSLAESWLLVFKEEYDDEYQEMADIPLLILKIDSNTKVRQSSALDLEISATNSITKEKMLIIARCYNAGLLSSISTNLLNVRDTISNDSNYKQLSSCESNNTLASSSMSAKPSASSTLNSIYTALNDCKSPAQSNSSPESVNKSGLNMLLMDRMTVKLHKQLESYERIHHISSWKAISMYTMEIFHSTEHGKDGGTYHFELKPQGDYNEKEVPIFSWAFEGSNIFDKIETIGKAGLLVKVDPNEIFMVECKGKRQLARLYGIF
ncbi:hypothetical protein EJF18_20487 [Clavispora lusitaniae]|uniref:Uncharacterized protein n=1 Tax=Clavispora lusitaniae TaxID=36911 RepID=A0ACD0WGB5_CLALS|nr:hypothetical protein EJF14_20487 [Clavispora lusitaniae]QFZ32250.1 hypothetical protein EJF16_20487 [Clavispora lusitaniae]QFZ37919.1 hypothetical protein EJF15_20487 [Clavispora lusitaniae]QFZ43602.1 hypothetical protein EJF18_20487 [Clavispora lusitaniae]QFZ49279.1 hypothetical protein EJF17_20487 [Clavispora lusitaniae]